ncbi:MAG TPA: exodeoxyribonuclease V subunit alpha [Ignavibacteriales bacterium]|nr:exodeoxyribonuclease V subunit alpha [Ignavibacteriales bacterium]HOL80747.1 exodeoxyribonuclease V subunit alpha [Ignavibacteriales bacterium]HOM65994.1 exodeoxyribonuclease V subunit alpha [Ignavibacteriales bacterium]HPD67772.1 exodeoxyribonuclease V subunit alpha [Ignavibacteriales bacterium]HPP33183.1 exodeoxyribonuclease V subunit alpha [Ignavibacteriales bacterium]
MEKLKLLKDSKLITDFCYYFAEFIAKLENNNNELIEIIAALTSSAVLLKQDIYFSLDELYTLPQEITKSLPAKNDIINILKSSNVVGAPGSTQPIILEKDRVYLNKFYQYEKLTAQIINKLINSSSLKTQELHNYQNYLEILFGKEKDNPQRIAAERALNSNFFVLTGGPGTGKTTTVAKILLMLLKSNPELKIGICAPTGKAAARLQTSIDNFLAKEKDNIFNSHDFSDIYEKFPRTASTIHSLLKSKFPSPKFKYNKDNYLDLNLIVVDEASMISLPLFYKLISALNPQSRIMLIGDKNQLSSVEPGNVFGDICKFIFSQKLECYVELTKNYRFGDDSGIYSISNFINQQDIKKVSNFFSQNNYKDIVFNTIPSSSEEFIKFIESKVVTHFEKYFYFHPQSESDLLKKYQYLEKFIILTDTRNLSFGKNKINYIVENIIAKHFHITNTDWYDGKIIIITQNDYNTKLYNGDVGFVDKDYFVIKSGSELRKIHRFRLPEYESAFSLTIHKSQGSEYDNVMIILGDKESKILTKELIYTAITRARKFVEIYSYKDLFLKGIQQETERQSGLLEKLLETT